MSEKGKDAAQSTIVPRKCELKFGYQDKETPDKLHTSVIFGKRATGGDVIRAADNAQGAETQYTLEMVAGAITAFGDLSMPVPLTVLLSLDEIDRDKLVTNFFEFMDDTSGEKTKQTELGVARLAFGVERDGVRYDVVKFGKRLTGYDDVEIEREAHSEAEQTVLKRAKRVTEISTSDGKTIAGSMTLAEMQVLDYQDFVVLQEVGDSWLNSFR